MGASWSSTALKGLTMNTVMQTMLADASVRQFTEQPVPADWSAQTAAAVQKKQRTHMLKFLQTRGLLLR